MIILYDKNNKFKQMKIKLRRYAPGDLQEIIGLFQDTIVNINIKGYSKDQIEASAAGANI